MENLSRFNVSAFLGVTKAGECFLVEEFEAVNISIKITGIPFVKSSFFVKHRKIFSLSNTEIPGGNQ